ncbi:MAG: hypothetical protein GX817_07045 [Elusimicrobia bacterium]|nr:hypothetical protein [Elusimicrobiota bacterium]
MSLPIRKERAAGNPEKALELLSRTSLPEEEKNRLLYHIEAGLLYHLTGNYSESNKFFENAEWISDEMYTRSLSQEAAALLTSETILPYRGEYFDYLFVNYYKMLNYLYLGMFESALVEVRRINYKLSLFEEDAAMLHWLTGMLHRASGEESSALIEYMKAYRAYKETYPEKYGISLPESLKKDIAVFSRESRLPRIKEFPKDIRESYSPPKDYGSAIFIVETGLAPMKYAVHINADIPQHMRQEHDEVLADIYHISVSIPEYAPPEDPVRDISIRIGSENIKPDLAEDIGGLAIRKFNEKKPLILAQATARAVTKYVAYRAARGEDADDFLRVLLGSAVNIAGAITEEADTRSWLTLPGRVYVLREYLAPGDYNFNLQTISQSGRRGGEEGSFSLKQGEIKFILLRNNFTWIYDIFWI